MLGARINLYRMRGAWSKVKGRGGNLQWRSLSQEVRANIERTLASGRIVLFMKGTPGEPACGFSRAVVQLLHAQGVDSTCLTTVNVLTDPALRSGIKEYADWQTIPQLYVDGEFIGGCDIVYTMFKDGSLAKLFRDKHIIPNSPRQ